MKADIAIPRTKVDYFTYETELMLDPGDLVIVPIRSKFKHGIVVNSDSKRTVAGIKKVKEVVERRFIPTKMLELYL